MLVDLAFLGFSFSFIFLYESWHISSFSAQKLIRRLSGIFHHSYVSDYNKFN